MIFTAYATQKGNHKDKIEMKVQTSLHFFPFHQLGKIINLSMLRWQFPKVLTERFYCLLSAQHGQMQKYYTIWFYYAGTLGNHQMRHLVKTSLFSMIVFIILYNCFSLSSISLEVYLGKESDNYWSDLLDHCNVMRHHRMLNDFNQLFSLFSLNLDIIYILEKGISKNQSYTIMAGDQEREDLSAVESQLAHKCARFVPQERHLHLWAPCTTEN